MGNEPASESAAEAPLTASARWWGGRVFEAESRGRRIAFDPSGREGVAPAEGALASLASSLGTAIVDTLEAARIPFDGLEVRASARRRGGSPHAFASVDVEVCLTRADQVPAERAVALAESCCPVSAMLRAAGVDLRVRTVVAPLAATPARR